MRIESRVLTRTAAILGISASDRYELFVRDGSAVTYATTISYTRRADASTN
jgi:hypothetical protein